MLPTEKKIQQMSFNRIYDNYSAPLYGLILKFADNTYLAQEILIVSITSFLLQNSNAGLKNCNFSDVLKVTIPIVSEKTNLPKQHIVKIIFKEIRQVKQLQST